VSTACGTVRQNEMFLRKKQKNTTLFKLEEKIFPYWRGNKIYWNRKGNSFPEKEKYRSYVKTLM
jgi:hypothetical protein